MSEQGSMSRRSLAALLGSAVAGAAANAAAPAAGQAAPAQATAAGSEAEAALRRNSEALAKVDVPRDTEPAFRFQA